MKNERVQGFVVFFSHDLQWTTVVVVAVVTIVAVHDINASLYSKSSSMLSLCGFSFTFYFIFVYFVFSLKMKFKQLLLPQTRFLRKIIISFLLFVCVLFYYKFSYFCLFPSLSPGTHSINLFICVLCMYVLFLPSSTFANVFILLFPSNGMIFRI